MRLLAASLRRLVRGLVLVSVPVGLAPDLHLAKPGLSPGLVWRKAFPYPNQTWLFAGEDLVPEPPVQAQAAGQGEGDDGAVAGLPAPRRRAGARQGRQALLRLRLLRARGRPGQQLTETPLFSAYSSHIFTPSLGTAAPPPPGEVGVHPAGVLGGGGGGGDGGPPHRRPAPPHAHGLRRVQALAGSI